MKTENKSVSIDGERVPYRIAEGLLKKFDAAIKSHGIYDNRSETIRALIAQYISQNKS